MVLKILRKGLHKNTKVINGDWIVFYNSWLGPNDDYIIDENNVRYNVIEFCYITDREPIQNPFITSGLPSEVNILINWSKSKRSCLLLDKEIDININIIGYGNSKFDKKEKEGRED